VGTWAGFQRVFCTGRPGSPVHTITSIEVGHGAERQLMWEDGTNRRATMQPPIWSESDPTLPSLASASGNEPTVSESLCDIGQEPEAVLALANTAEIKDALTAETATARDLGIFGSPTFAVGRELFWGDDRLDDP
jgi:hypothetical protein